jgi:SAM-dependent methyltransferase
MAREMAAGRPPDAIDRAARSLRTIVRGGCVHPPPDTPSWMLDEVAFAGRENLDVGHVSRYDRKEDADASGEVALLAGLGLDDSWEVVDLGAGTGQFALAAATRCGHLTAVDVSAPMIELLRDKVCTAGLANVDVVRAGFLTYEHRRRPADLVYSRFALHHLPDFFKALALARMRRMLASGGVLRLWDVVFDFDPAEATGRIDAWCATLPAEVPDDQWGRADVEEHVRDEHSTFTWLLEPMLERAGFEIDVADHSPDGLFARYLARAA